MVFFCLCVCVVPHNSVSAQGECVGKDGRGPLTVTTVWFYPVPCYMLIIDGYLCSGECIWLKTTMQQVPLDLIWNEFLHAPLWTPAWDSYKGVGENMNLRSYLTPLANVDQLAPSHTQGLSAHWPPSCVMNHWLVCVKSRIDFICVEILSDDKCSLKLCSNWLFVTIIHFMAFCIIICMSRPHFPKMEHLRSKSCL